MMSLAAVVSVAWVVRDIAEPSQRPTSAEVCAVLADVREAMDVSSVGDQAVLPARAAELADMLSHGRAGGAWAWGPDAAVRIVAVLDDSGATLADLADALVVVSRQCGEPTSGR